MRILFPYQRDTLPRLCLPLLWLGDLACWIVPATEDLLDEDIDGHYVFPIVLLWIAGVTGSAATLFVFWYMAYLPFGTSALIAAGVYLACGALYHLYIEYG